jgi:hypothetical protein
MKRRNGLILFLSGCLAAALASPASAQPGQPQPPPPGYGYGYGGGGAYQPLAPQGRQGLAIGFGFGIGGMEADSGPIRCDGCTYDPVAAGGEFHIGGMLAPNMALLGEFQLTALPLDADNFETLQQVMALAAVQYWLSPMLWIKGGVGLSALGISYNDGTGDSAELDRGIGLLAAVGYEVLHAPRFAIDIQLRLSSGNYNSLDDEIHSGLFGVGFNWY